MSNDYVIMTDTNCDLPIQYLKDNDIVYLEMNLIIDGITYYERDMTVDEFYGHVRAGKKPTTTSGNAEDIKELMRAHVEAGKDLLYIVFSSGLSGTFGNATLAAGELTKIYPERKIIVIDSLCASMGQGLLIHKVCQMKKQGASIDEVAQWTVENRLHITHLVMADDLMHLYRGGRVSRTSAIAGSMLGIKPIIHMNDEGKLIPIDKIRGKKQALTNLVDKVEALAGSVENDYFMVSHSDCADDAQFVVDLMVKRFGINDYMINYIGPVIGSHTGVGTVALFFMGEHR